MTTLVTQSEFAALEGVAKSYITELKKSGRLVMVGDKVDVQASRKRIRDTADQSHAGVAERHQKNRTAAPSENVAADATAEKIGNSFQAARAVKEKYNAMQAKLDYERAVGELVVRESVAFAANDIAATFRIQIGALPDIMAPQLAAISDEAEIRIMLAEAIEHALNELANKLSEMGSAP